MPEGPFGGPRPFASGCDLVMEYRVTGIPRKEREADVFNSLQNNIENSLGTRVSEVFIQKGVRSSVSNTATIVIALDSAAKGHSLNILENDDAKIRGTINSYEELGSIDISRIRAGDAERIVRGSE